MQNKSTNKNSSVFKVTPFSRPLQPLKIDFSLFKTKRKQHKLLQNYKILTHLAARSVRQIMGNKLTPLHQSKSQSVIFLVHVLNKLQTNNSGRWERFFYHGFPRFAYTVGISREYQPPVTGKRLSPRVVEEVVARTVQTAVFR